MINIQNRRYLGNKFKISGFISEVLKKSIGDYDCFCDLFAGTGAIAFHINSPEKEIIANDILYCNYVCLKAFLTWNKPVTLVTEKINFLNSLNPQEENYFSDNFGGLYFTKENARKIGFIRENINSIAESEEEKELLICSLLYATDKVANTVGHYDSYRKKLDSFQPIRLETPKINYQQNLQNRVFNEDGNKLIKRIDPDVLYLDPPYNSRQYSDTYHLLENLATWNKPEVFGVAKKMNRSNLKSEYCTKKAGKALEELIQSSNTKIILLSYNNTGNKKDVRSNATISDEEIIQIFRNKGDLKIYERQYRAFTTGKSKTDDHTERIFVCNVR